MIGATLWINRGEARWRGQGRLVIALRVLTIARCTAVFVARAVMAALHRASRSGRIAALTAVGRELTRYLEALGPSFIKFGQILQTRSDLLPTEVVAPLRRLHEHVEPLAFASIESALKRSYGERFHQLFHSIDPVPIGAGAIAQVHRAVTADGRDVALKVLKPDVRSLQNADAKIIRIAASLLARMPAMRNVPVCEIVGELTSILQAQSNFIQEAENMRRFSANFKNIEGVKFPELIDELCTDTVVAMEYMKNLVRVDIRENDKDEGRRFALAGLRALYLMIFDHGFIHADMHPGNVFRSSFGRLAILDAGLVAEVSERTRKNFVDFFFAVANNQGHACADLIWRTALARRRESLWPAFQSEIIEFVDRYSSKKSGEFEVVAFVRELLAIQRRHELRSSPEFISIVLAMVVFDGVCRILYPGCDFQVEARGYLIAAKFRLKARSRSLPP